MLMGGVWAEGSKKSKHLLTAPYYNFHLYLLLTLPTFVDNYFYINKYIIYKYIIQLNIIQKFSKPCIFFLILIE